MKQNMLVSRLMKEHRGLFTAEQYERLISELIPVDHTGTPELPYRDYVKPYGMKGNTEVYL